MSRQPSLPLPGPPRALEAWLRRRLAASGAAEFILGDLREEYVAMRSRAGATAAALWYAAQALRLATSPSTRRLRRPALPDRTSPSGPIEMLLSTLQDVRFGARMLRKNPLFTLAAVLTLALGIGANAAIFSMVNAVLLRPLPFPDAERLVRVYSAYPSSDNFRGTASAPDLRDWRDLGDAFDNLTAFPAVSVGGFVLTGRQRPDRVLAHYVEEGFFETLGAPPLLGRTIGLGDHPEGANGVVVLSYGSWQSRFGGDPGIVGTSVTLSDAPYTIIGVMPPSFAYPSRDAEIWVPLSVIPEDGIPRQRGVRFLSVVGRLKPGVSLETAQASLTTVAARLAQEYPDSNDALTEVRLVPLQQQLTGDVQTGLLTLLGAVGAVLLICCANVANLMLVRAQGRARELAVRAALGAGGARLARQLVTEALLLASLGGALGLALGAAALRALLALTPGEMPRLEEVGIDPVVVGFAFAVSVLTGVLFGLAPALRAWRGELHGELKIAGGSGAGGETRNRARGLLVLAEAAMVMVLVIGAGLLLRSLDRLMQVDPGFDVDRSVAMHVAAPGYRLDDSAQIAAFYDEVLARVRDVPGVRAAGVVRPMPLTADTFQGEDFRFTVVGRPQPPAGQEPAAAMRFASDQVFQALGVPLLEGRDFDERDDRDAGVVRVIVNQTLAATHFPGGSAVGERLAVGRGEMEIIGVVGDVRQRRLDEPATAVVYTTLRQVTRVGMTLVVRTEGSPLNSLAAIQEAIWKVNPDQPIEGIATLSELVRGSMAEQRFSAMLVGLFAALALLLATVGIYGVVSSAVAQRGREIGIRMALGARGTDIVRWVVGHGIGWVAAGIGVGAAVAALLSRLVDSMLFQVAPTDPLTYAGAAVVLLGVAIVASLLPARRATAIDPMASLRGD